MIEKISDKMRYKKAIQYLRCVDYSMLVQISNKIQSFHINEKMGSSFFHHLPLKNKNKDYLLVDNWDLSEEIKKELFNGEKKNKRI